MNNRIIRRFVAGALFGLLAVAPLIANAASLSERLSGRIVLQVQEKGKAWYINPATQERAYLGRPSDAFRIMRELGLGITTADLERISTSDDSNSGDTKFARRLVGKILLQVQAAGEAWYINPVDLKRYYLGRPSDAFSIMRNLGLGVSNADIGKIPTAEKYTDPEQSSALPKEEQEAKAQEQEQVEKKTETKKDPVQEYNEAMQRRIQYESWSKAYDLGSGIR